LPIIFEASLLQAELLRWSQPEAAASVVEILRRAPPLEAPPLPIIFEASLLQAADSLQHPGDSLQYFSADSSRRFTISLVVSALFALIVLRIEDEDRFFFFRVSRVYWY
jgi:hypothetical protein